MLGSSQEAENQEKLDFISSIECFKSWPQDEIKDLAFKTKFKTYTNNHVISQTNMELESVHFINKGKCEVMMSCDIPSCMAIQHVDGASTKPGAQNLLMSVKVLTRGDSFGETDAGEGATRYIVARGKCRCLLIQKHFFFMRDYGRTLNALKSQTLQAYPKSEDIDRVLDEKRRWKTYKKRCEDIYV